MLDSSKRSTLLSVALHAGAILLLLAVTNVQQFSLRYEAHDPLVLPIELSAHHAATGRGSGGTRSPTPATIGRPPKPSLHPFTPPLVVQENDRPRLTIEPAVLSEDKLPTIDLAQFGDIFGTHEPPSNGTGDGGGIGDHHGTGVGHSQGPGFGNGPDGLGTGVRLSAGFDGWLTAPVLLTKTEPEYTEEARRARIQGTVVLRIEVDELGQVRSVNVTDGLGLGLDERAVDAVRRWRFRPGTRNGKPVVTSALVEVNFRLL